MDTENKKPKNQIIIVFPTNDPYYIVGSKDAFYIGSNAGLAAKKFAMLERMLRDGKLVARDYSREGYHAIPALRVEWREYESSQLRVTYDRIYGPSKIKDMIFK